MSDLTPQEGEFLEKIKNSPSGSVGPESFQQIAFLPSRQLLEQVMHMDNKLSPAGKAYIQNMLDRYRR